MAILMDGKQLREKKYQSLITRVETLKSKGVFPHLVVVQVGDVEASNIYVKNKQLACEKLGIKSSKIHFPESIDFSSFKKEIQKLNDDSSIHGILIQFPLPKHLNNEEIATLVGAKKDADGFHPFNQGVNFTKGNIFAPIPCTPNGIMEFFKDYQIDLKGKDVVVLGRSNIVGKPIASLLVNHDATVTILHTKTTRDSFLRQIKNADIIISATGVLDPFTPSEVKNGVIIIDVGMHRNEDKTVRGDIAYKQFLDKASYITPVPGGVGVMTVTMLMENVIALAENFA